jgi:hypothetical protein
VLRQDASADGGVDQDVQERVPREDDPLAGDLHLDELVQPVHGQHGRLQLDEPAVGGALRVVGGDAAVQLGRFYTFWQYSSSPIDQDQFSADISRLKVPATG